MAVQQYNLVANDWLNLEYIINDLTQRVVGQELHPTSTPTFADITITGDLDLTGDLDVTGDLDIGGTVTFDDLTTSRLVATDGSKGLVSSDLYGWVAGTANKVTITDDSSGGFVVTLPDALSLVNPTVSGTLDASAGEVLVEDNATVEPEDKSNGYVGVAEITGQGRMYFEVGGIMYYVTADAAVVSPTTGNPIGLGLLFTYV